MVLVSIAMYILHIDGVSRLLLGFFLVLDICLLTLSKFIIFHILRKIRKNDLNIRNVLIIGSHEHAREVIKIIEQNKSTGYRLLGCFETEEEKFGKKVDNGHEVIGIVKDLETYLRNNIVDEFPIGSFII